MGSSPLNEEKVRYEVASGHRRVRRKERAPQSYNDNMHKSNTLLRTRSWPRRKAKKTGPRRGEGVSSWSLRGGLPQRHSNDRSNLLGGRHDMSTAVELARGGYGCVYRVFDEITKKHVALKLQIGQVMHANFVREVRVLAYLRQFRNSNIVWLIGHFQYKQETLIRYYLTMELLSTDLHRTMYAGSQFTIKTTRRIAKQICDALAFLRQVEVVHCDLKPGNILLCRAGWTWIKISDFRLSYMPAVHHKPKVVQTLGYRAPEVMLSQRRSYAIDMWSFGVILTQMYTHSLPFRGWTELHSIRQMVAVLGMPSNDLLRSFGSAERHFTLNKDGNYELVDVLDEALENPKNLEELIVQGGEQQDVNNELTEKRRQLCDLVRRIFVFDDIHRLTPDQALQHDFFSQYEDELQHLNVPIERCVEECYWIETSMHWI
ncbi:serine/threonine-protein kinase minibrain-like [Varroa jacobsoni]|uniref:serine/threonine-protein kinase minibrain-like n=1 Tax=Varroa jacobsoni TaxID=62625 RepID=UPI000BF53275|nr:serine/threonine-protein kinase minibrain-like [Varroa jacobsoni]